MPFWLQVTLVVLIWLLFWPMLGHWAWREGRLARRPRVRDLYPPRVPDRRR